MSAKKLNADAPSFSYNPSAKAWSPGTPFVPAAMNVTSPPIAAPAPVPTTTVAPASEPLKVEPIVEPAKPQDGGPKPVQPKTPVWGVKKNSAPKTEGQPPAKVEAVPTQPSAPVAIPPTTNEKQPQATKRDNKDGEVELTFGEFNGDNKKPAAEKPSEKLASTPAPAPTPAPAVVEESKPAAPAVPTPTVPKTTGGWGTRSFAAMAAAAPAVPPPPRPPVAKAAPPKDNKDNKSNKDNNRKRDKKNKNNDKRNDDHSRNSKNGDNKSSNKSKQEPARQQGGSKQQQSQKQAPSKQAEAPKPQQPPVKQPEAAPKAAPEPAPKHVEEAPVVTPKPVVEAAPTVPTFAAKAAAAAKQPPPQQIPVVVKKKEAPPPAPPAPTPVPAPVPIPVVVKAPVVKEETKEAPPAPAPVVETPAPVETPKETPTPSTTAPPPPAPAATTTAPRKPAAQEENWRSAPVRSLRPGGTRADGLGGMDRPGAAAGANGEKSPANEGRWGRATLPPAPNEDPSTGWSQEEGGVRHTLFSLLALKPLSTKPPANMDMDMPIIHLYEHKAAEEETKRAAAERDNKGGRGPLRPKAPPKQYEKPKWAAGTMEGEEAEVMRKALFILNKLTVEKFQKLSEEFLNVGFTSVPLLEGAIDIIVDKAQMEHHFGAMYANLCLMLAKNPLAELGEADKGKQFKKSLLERCQKEFEKDQKEILEKLNEIEDKEERDAQILVVRKRYLGHMKFVGQLFRVQLLSDKIMHICVKELFGDSEEPDEEKIQCLCTLLTTIGGQLESSAVNKPEKEKAMKKYLKDIKSLSTNQKISSRIRFMCKDLLEMRENGWNSRREEESAKTIAQIHQEANREQGKGKGGGGGGGSPRAQGGGNSSPRSGNNSRGGGSPRSGNQPQDVRQASAADSEWTSIKTSGRSNKRTTNNNTNAVTPSSANAREKPVAGGGFGAFAEKEKKDKQEKKEKKERKEKEKEAKEAKRAQKESAAEAAAPAAAPTFKMTVDQYSNSCKTEFEQHINGGSISEVIESMTEFGIPVPMGHVVSMINVVLNYLFTTLATDSAVNTGCSLLIELIKQNIIDKAAVQAGFSKFLENIEDYVCDAPKAEGWLSQVIARLVAADMITLGCFADAGGLLKEGWKLEEFFGFSTNFLIKTLVACRDNDEVKKSSSDLLQEAKLDIRALAEDNEALDKMLTEYGITL
jgi:translation initiation factor 4G